MPLKVCPQGSYTVADRWIDVWGEGKKTFHFLRHGVSLVRLFRFFLPRFLLMIEAFTVSLLEKLDVLVLRHFLII